MHPFAWFPPTAIMSSHNGKIMRSIAWFLLIVILSSCNGIFGGIYDSPTGDDSPQGFVSTSDNSGIIYIDATDWGSWNYVSLKSKTIVTMPLEQEYEGEWDFAVHKYDASTNGAMVAESQSKDITGIPENLTEFTGDIWTEDRIMADMSEMISGNIGYAKGWYNEVLSRWLDLDISVMPPIYTLSQRVYVLRLSDGTSAALRLKDYMSKSFTKGFLTIEYVYPLPI